MAVSQDAIQAVLREQFGFDSFRPGQKRVIDDLLKGRDVLAVLPTGAGKSLVYQLTAQLLPGITLVVSPLLSLMRDQEESLEEKGVAVSAISSAKTEAESEDAMERAAQDEAKLLYVTPERFGNAEFMAQVKEMSISLFVVDEAHCISEWGHDFRPAYLTLPTAIEQVGRPPVLALTATATPWIRREIIERLELRDPDLVVRGTDRPNLFLEVRRVETEEEDRRALQHLLLDDPEEDGYPPEIAAQMKAAMAGSGIIYTATTKAAEETAGWLLEWGINAGFYHGQRKKADRERVQDAFMAGDLQVIVATNAFGMGVDKADVRFVIHRDVPGSLEAYYQEAGRAGRDGAFARCTVLYRPGDLGRAAFLSGSSRLTPEDVQCAHDALIAQREAPLAALLDACDLSKADLVRVLGVLEGDGLVEEHEGVYRLAVDDFDPAAVSLDQEEHRKAYEKSRLEMMRGYAETDDCRRRYILNYFGEETEAEQCDACDNDVQRAGEVRVTVAVASEQPTGPALFAVGDAVSHTAWGAGVVQRVTAESITVLFDTEGYKTLATALVTERGPLQPA